MAIFNSYVKLPRGTPKIIRIISSSLMAHRPSTMFTLGRIKFKASNDTLGTESKPMMHDNAGSWFIGIVIGNPKRVIFFPSFFSVMKTLGLWMKDLHGTTPHMTCDVDAANDFEFCWLWLPQPLGKCHAQPSTGDVEIPKSWNMFPAHLSRSERKSLSARKPKRRFGSRWEKTVLPRNLKRQMIQQNNIYSWGYNPPTTWGESPSYTIVTGACFLRAVPVLDGFLSPPVLVLHELSLPSGLFLVLVASFLCECEISVPGACPITMFAIVLWRNPPFLGSWWPGWIPHFNGGSDSHLQHDLLENHPFSSMIFPLIKHLYKQHKHPSTCLGISMVSVECS